MSQPLTTYYRQQANAVFTDLAMISEATVAVPRKLTKCAAPHTEADWDNTEMNLDSSVLIHVSTQDNNTYLHCTLKIYMLLPTMVIS